MKPVLITPCKICQNLVHTVSLINTFNLLFVLRGAKINDESDFLLKSSLQMRYFFGKVVPGPLIFRRQIVNNAHHYFDVFVERNQFRFIYTRPSPVGPR
jgi:hypothetical protein